MATATGTDTDTHPSERPTRPRSRLSPVSHHSGTLVVSAAIHTRAMGLVAIAADIDDVRATRAPSMFLACELCSTHARDRAIVPYP
jgi:hypothetical protein